MLITKRFIHRRAWIVLLLYHLQVPELRFYGDYLPLQADLALPTILYRTGLHLCDPSSLFLQSHRTPHAQFATPIPRARTARQFAGKNHAGLTFSLLDSTNLEEERGTGERVLNTSHLESKYQSFLFNES